jgi:DDE superfamily endonuclease
VIWERFLWQSPVAKSVIQTGPLLVERFEWHYTPKHGSWLDMAEAELSVLSRQCLDRRIPNKQALIEEVAAWEEDRNKNHTNADWQFTTADARSKLKRLYPPI